MTFFVSVVLSLALQPARRFDAAASGAASRGDLVGSVAGAAVAFVVFPTKTPHDARWGDQKTGATSSPNCWRRQGGERPALISSPGRRRSTAPTGTWPLLPNPRRLLAARHPPGACAPDPGGVHGLHLLARIFARKMSQAAESPMTSRRRSGKSEARKQGARNRSGLFLPVPEVAAPSSVICRYRATTQALDWRWLPFRSSVFIRRACGRRAGARALNPRPYMRGKRRTEGTQAMAAQTANANF